jgi:hypothetical protein
MNREEYWQWRDYVFRCHELTPTQRLVLLRLQTYSDYPAGTNARPGRAALADDCNLGTRVVDTVLKRARLLGLIEQTARANPKAHIAATYRLVPIRNSVRHETVSGEVSTRTTLRLENVSEDVSTRTSVQVEDVSTRTEPVFNSHAYGVSTRTMVRATNPLRPNHYHQLRCREESRTSIPLATFHRGRPP